MKIVRALLAPVGGGLMIWAYWLPWGQATFMGFQRPTFTAAELAEQDPAWWFTLLAAIVTTAAGLALAALWLRPRSLAHRVAGGVAALAPAASLLFIGQTFLRLHGQGIRLGWIEGATAQSLELTYRLGLPVEIAGAVLALGAFAALALGRDGA